MFEYRFLIDLFAVMNMSTFFLFFPIQKQNFYCPIDGNFFFLLLHGEKITAPDGAASDHFRISVSQSGNILAVGAYDADPGGLSNAGAAYVYQLEANGSAT